MAMGFTIQEMVLDGWTIDPEIPVAPCGFNLECGFVRTVYSEEETKEKQTRAEILAKARAAKAERKLKQGNSDV